MSKKLFRRYILLFLLALLTACSKYDTDVVGEQFVPFSGLVGSYTHLVYVEFHDDKVDVWGPAVNEISVNKEGARVTIDCKRDSMAFVCFGTSLNDSLHSGDGQLHIVADQPFALYLNSIRLTSLDGPAIWLDTDEEIQVVVTGKTASVLSDRKYQTYRDEEGFELVGSPDACFMARGAVTFSGTGSLRIRSEAPVFVNDYDETCYPHALHAMGGMRCAFAIKMDLQSRYGDAIHVDADEVAIGDGTWALYAGRYAIANESGAVAVTGGKVYGSSAGSFVHVAQGQGFSVAEASCIAAAGDTSLLSAESAQNILQPFIDSLTMMADTTYVINRKDTVANAKYSSVGNLTPRLTLTHPYLLLSTSAITLVDSIQVNKK